MTSPRPTRGAPPGGGRARRGSAAAAAGHDGAATGDALPPASADRRWQSPFDEDRPADRRRSATGGTRTREPAAAGAGRAWRAASAGDRAGPAARRARPGRRDGAAAPRPAWPASTARIGISGWRYPPWRGVFYPPGLPQRRELEYASGRLNSVEINGSFYSLQRPSSYAKWRAETPPGFVFSVKGPRFVTHMKKLAGVEAPLANFFASGVLALGDQLGPVLWQLPPSLGFDPERLERFFALLPRTTGDAAELATHHDARLEGENRALTVAEDDRPLRHALEVRHHSFEKAEFVELLRAHDVALVVADTAGKWPLPHDATSDFVYVRLHGEQELYVSGYDEPAIEAWAARLRTWQAGGTPDEGRTLAPPAPRRDRDVFVYFDNDVKVRAPFDALALAAALGVPQPEPAPVG